MFKTPQDLDNPELSATRGPDRSGEESAAALRTRFDRCVGDVKNCAHRSSEMASVAAVAPGYVLQRITVGAP